ncbi:hypothetical protein ANCCAN_16466 [Ancylostoma caninum]|uniref:Uncharacterized protein n=1 Tax=Ancylostoma caninum TaxID=29170 RepID=A0A368G4Q8_ANCCA|nr:hypothetical protein ANCCAN_16466 [Ancylostoma caninum]
MLSVPRRRSDRIRLVLAYPRTEDSEQMLLLADEPGPSGHLCAGAGELVSLASPAFTQPDSREELDPFKIRALLDNMKQMVAADSADTSCEPSTSRSASSGRFRSGSGRSLSTMAVQPFEAGQGVGMAPKRRGILHSLFSLEKGNKK